MNRNLQRLLLGLCLAFFWTSCVKDTDFNQAEDIATRPVVETNLVFFNLEGAEFYDTAGNIPRETLTDTTEIRFLDDEGFQESVLRAEFLFRFNNTIPRDFVVDFEFVSEQGELTYATSTTVPAGSTENPSIPPDFIVPIEGEDVIALTSANRVVVNVSMENAIPGLPGQLDMQSVVTFYLEFKERD